MYHAIFVSNVETGETKQITDGLADAMWPVWDASGKYLWFLASTDFGLRSQWLDMTSYDREETSGSTSRCSRRASRARCCPRATRTAASAAARPAAEAAWRRTRRASASGTDAGAQARSSSRPHRRGRATPVTVQIDFDGLQQRIISVPGVPERQYSQLRAGVAGHGLLPRSAPQAAAGAAVAAAAARCIAIG